MPAPARAAAGGQGPAAMGSAQSRVVPAAGGTSLTVLPATSSIIYTASLTVRTTQPHPGRGPGHAAGPRRRRRRVK